MLYGKQPIDTSKPSKEQKVDLTDKFPQVFEEFAEKDLLVVTLVV